jgi:hypothetical protein
MRQKSGPVKESAARVRLARCMAAPNAFSIFCRLGASTFSPLAEQLVRSDASLEEQAHVCDEIVNHGNRVSGDFVAGGGLTCA